MSDRNPAGRAREHEVDIAEELYSRLGRVTMIASQSDCESSRRAIHRLIPILEDGADAIIDEGFQLRNTGVNTAFRNAGDYVMTTAPHDCFDPDESEDLRFAIRDGAEILDDSRPDRRHVEETVELLKEGAGRRTSRRDNCKTVALAVAEALQDECSGRF